MNKSFWAYITIFLAFTGVSCSSFKTSPPSGHGRTIASDELTEIERDLYKSTYYMNRLLRSKSFTADNCSAMLGQISSRLFAKDPRDFRQNMTMQELLETDKALFDMRLNLRLRLTLFHKKDELTKECAKMAKAHMAIYRDVEDFITEKMLRVNPKAKELRPGVFQGGDPWLSLNKRKLKSFSPLKDLKSGDVIMWRGSADITSLYSRLGAEYNTFTHLSLIHQDAISGDMVSIEANADQGVTIRPVSEVLTSYPERATLFRFHDESIAAAASQKIYDELKKKLRRHKVIEYDFYFDYYEQKKFFNTEVINSAFFDVSNGEIQIPLYKTSFELNNPQFLNDLGLSKINEAFQPSDMDIDPRFELVAEWRNFHFSQQEHLKKLIWAKMFQWMEQENYVFSKNFQGQLKYFMNLFGKNEFSGKLKGNELNLMMSFDEVANILLSELNKRIEGKKIHYSRDYQDIIEKIKEKDLADYHLQKEKNRRGEAHPNPLFHHFFRPKDL